MNKNFFFIFALDNLSYAVDLFCVKRIIQAVEITPVPECRNSILGIINVNGTIVPVIDIRQKLNLPFKMLDPNDIIVILTITNRTIAFVVDSVNNISELKEENIIRSTDILPGLDNIEGVIKIRSDLILLHDLHKLFSLADKENIQALLNDQTC